MYPSPFSHPPAAFPSLTPPLGTRYKYPTSSYRALKSTRPILAPTCSRHARPRAPATRAQTPHTRLLDPNDRKPGYLPQVRLLFASSSPPSRRCFSRSAGSTSSASSPPRSRPSQPRPS
eukprot:6172056-Pleurochrysis_carterae.AAC.1